MLKNKRPTLCHLLFYFTSYVLNMFWTLIYPSSGACNFFLLNYHIGRIVLGLMCVGVSAEACIMDTTPTQPHRNSNTHRTKNNTTNVVIQQNSRKLLMMDILMSETCSAHKKWNKIASDIKLVFYSSTITMMHGPINIRYIYIYIYICLPFTNIQYTACVYTILQQPVMATTCRSTKSKVCPVAGNVTSVQSSWYSKLLFQPIFCGHWV